MRTYSLFLLFFALAFSQCKKPPIILKQPTVITSPVVWKAERTNKGGRTSNIHIYKNMAIMATMDSDESCKIVAHNLSTGALVWENTEIPVKFDPYDDQECFTYENYIVFAEGYYFYCFNMDNGAKQWGLRLENSSSIFSIIDGKIYTSDDNYTANMWSIDIKTGVKEHIMAIAPAAHEGYQAGFCPPSKWVHPISGNTILISQNRSYHNVQTIMRMDIFAFDLTADSLLWYIKDFPKRRDYRVSSTQCAISCNKVYYFGEFEVFCVNAIDGKLIWQWETDAGDNYGGLKYANILLNKNQLIVKSNSKYIYALDKETGRTLWRNNETITMPVRLSLHNDTIWLGGIQAVLATNGKKIIDWDNGQGNAWINHVAPHPTNGTIITSDKHSIYCLNPKYMK